MARYYTTPGGYRRLRERLDKARQAYFDVCASNEEAAGAGDSSVWHDNFAYEENQRQMQALSRRVRDLERLLGRLEVAPVPATPADSVRLGTRVRIRYEDTGKEKVLFIAGYDDGDIAEHRISYNSPLGRLLIGKEEGDVVTARFGSREQTIEVLEILPPPPEEVTR